MTNDRCFVIRILYKTHQTLILHFAHLLLIETLKMEPPLRTDKWKLFIRQLNAIRRKCQSLIDSQCDEAMIKAHLRDSFHALMSRMESGNCVITAKHTQQMSNIHAHLLRGLQRARGQQNQRSKLKATAAANEMNESSQHILDSICSPPRILIKKAPPSIREPTHEPTREMGDDQSQTAMYLKAMDVIADLNAQNKRLSEDMHALQRENQSLRHRMALNVNGNAQRERAPQSQSQSSRSPNGIEFEASDKESTADQFNAWQARLWQNAARAQSSEQAQRERVPAVKDRDDEAVCAGVPELHQTFGVIESKLERLNQAFEAFK